MFTYNIISLYNNKWGFNIQITYMNKLLNTLTYIWQIILPIINIYSTINAV